MRWLLTLFIGTVALAGEVPHCFPGENGTNIYLRWDAAEKYERRVEARATRGGCEDWSPTSVWPWSAVPAGAREILGVPLSSEQRKVLEQIRLGADETREEMDAAYWLYRHPLTKFDLETNYDLSRRFGFGFAGEVYRAWIEKQPGNLRLRQRLLKHMAKDSPLSRPKDLVVAVSLGLGIDPANPADSVKGFVLDMPSYGTPTVFLKNDPWGGVNDNILPLRNQLVDLLDQGKQLIVIGLSKGAPEVLAALAMATRQPRAGKVIAYTGISGMYGGAFFADQYEQFAYKERFGLALQETFGGPLKQFGVLLEQIRSIHSDALSRLYAGFERELPQNVWYLNGVGIWPGNGLNDARENRMTGRFRELDRIVHVARGANDGFLEYPLTELPRMLAPHVNSAVFWSSHNLLDGGFGRYDLQVADNRRRFFNALYQVILEGPDAR